VAGSEEIHSVGGIIGVPAISEAGGSDANADIISPAIMKVCYHGKNNIIMSPICTKKHLSAHAV